MNCEHPTGFTTYGDTRHMVCFTCKQYVPVKGEYKLPSTPVRWTNKEGQVEIFHLPEITIVND